ncbi:hypothetical protein VTN77DRAFT_1751 [Rasamsonia byssochlamydoides]|uniref:uncharacterized protein n=1 Tax=Rasamsonia byssochlamydoides TaxID=89139 RepID=UPI003743F267
MAALETPWLASMSPPAYPQDNGAQPAARDPNPPTVAAFSPTTITGSSLTSRQRSSVIVHRKSPLLVATPPPVTRALAYSHPFILPLNKLVGLLSWSSGDPWESFLLVAAFWAIVLYSDVIILWAGPILVVAGLMLGMYSRRYSPLSSTGLTGEKHEHKRQSSEGSTRHHKSLDEIVETMREFTTRCNILLGPLLEMTDFLSTQRTATSATTRPALTALFIRILCVTPIWILLTLPPFYIITTRRVVLTVGTIILTYHSRPARVSRVILWRSLTVRRICSFLTGLDFSSDMSKGPAKEGTQSQINSRAPTIATKNRSGDPAGVRFTFIIYENQRRWLGIGWTYSLFPHERAPWTDEHLNPVPPKDYFELPETKGGNAVWRWVEGSTWRIEGGDDSGDGGGWIYYDNKWQDGRRGQDGWGRYTRRRKWFRDAELVEVDESASAGATADSEKATGQGNTDSQDDAASVTAPSTSSSSTRRRRWFSGSKDLKNIAVSSSSNPNAESSSPISPTTSGNAPSRPVSIHNSRSASSNNVAVASSYDTYSSSPGQRSVASSHRRRRGSGTVGTGDTDSSSIRKREIEEAQDRLDRWGARATGGTERAERELGLGDDVSMGLS